MRISVQHLPRFLVAGFSFFGDPFYAHAGWTEENEIGRVWKRLLDFLSQPTCPFPRPTVSYEIHLQTHETRITGHFEVFVGFEITPVELPVTPVELSIKVLPEGDYAVFTRIGAEIQKEEPYVEHWLAATARRQAQPFGIQRYDGRYKGLDRLHESELDMLVPVAPASSTPDGPA